MGLSAPKHLPDDVAVVWVEVVTAYGPGWESIAGPALEGYCGQVARVRDAQRRLAAEGMITEDPKGNPVPHPALAIERAAQAEVLKAGDRFSPPRRRR